MSRPSSLGPLKKLRQQKLDLSRDIDAFAAELNDSSDRTFAILLGSLLDEFLEEWIIRKLPQITPEDRVRIFSGYGPLSSFSSKILISYAMGIIGKRTKSSLSTIKEIRNAFAHSTSQISFSVPEVVTASRLLSIEYFPIPFLSSFGDQDARSKFGTACIFIIIQLQGKIQAGSDESLI